MKQRFTILLLLFILWSTSLSGVFAAEDAICETKAWYDLYNCRVKNICEIYNSKKPLYKVAKYENANTYKGKGLWMPAFEEAKKLYNTTISNHYKCAILNVQNKSLTRLKSIFIKLDKTSSLQNKLLPNIENQIGKNDISSGTIGCVNIKDTVLYNKQNVLTEATYETCKYSFYLEYLSLYYTDVGNALNISDSSDPEKSYPIEAVTLAITESQNKILDEKDKAMNLFPIVFSAYTDYENNFPVHIMLQLIKADYMIVRDKLQAVLNPINQVGYKIMNAMKQ